MIAKAFARVFWTRLFHLLRFRFKLYSISSKIGNFMLANQEIPVNLIHQHHTGYDVAAQKFGLNVNFKATSTITHKSTIHTK